MDPYFEKRSSKPGLALNKMRTVYLFVRRYVLHVRSKNADSEACKKLLSRFLPTPSTTGSLLSAPSTTEYSEYYGVLRILRVLCTPSTCRDFY
jgi:hypothetical protein